MAPTNQWPPHGPARIDWNTGNGWWEQVQNTAARTRGVVDTLQNNANHEQQTLRQEMTALRLEVTQLRAAVQQQQNFPGHVAGPQPGGPWAGPVAGHVADPPQMATIGNRCPPWTPGFIQTLF